MDDLEGDNNDVFFGNGSINGVPHVFTTGGVLYFAKQYGEVGDYLFSVFLLF